MSVDRSGVDTGTRASICCGDLRLPLSRFRAEVDALEYAILKARHNPWQTSGSLFTEILNAERSENNETLRALENDFNHQCSYVLANQNRMAQSGQKMPLAVLIRLFTSFECEDPRDTIYAALALTEWGEHSRIEPDYSKFKFDLAIEVLKICSSSAVSIDLLHNLKVNFDSPDIQIRYRLRRFEIEQTEQSLARIPFPTPHNKIEVSTLGHQLTDVEWNWDSPVIDRASETMELPLRARDDSPNAPLLKVPARTRPGDWLLPALEDTRVADYASTSRMQELAELMIVRQVGPIYAIVGRAVRRGELKNWLSLYNTFFTIWFDPADYLVLAASIGQLTNKELFRTSICSAPFSSFATMSGHKLDARRSSEGLEGRPARSLDPES
jgi:hypothetical protein